MKPGTHLVAIAALALASCASAPATRADRIRHTVVSDGHPLAVWEKSPASPVGSVLLLHGRTWSAVPDFDLQVPGEELSLMDGLVAAGFVTYGLDMRGYGSTPRDETGWLTPARAAADVASVLEWIRTQTGDGPRPFLFGWSLGSIVAQHAVQRRPELVSGVILFGYPLEPGTEPAARELPDDPPREANTAAAAASDFITEGSISRAAIDAYVEAALAADPVRVDWRGFEQWVELDPARVTVPVLLMQGEHDPLARTEAQAKLFAQLATSDRQWVVIPGGDHAAFLETPRAYFLDALVNFMLRPR